jgi:putative copper export protein
LIQRGDGAYAPVRLVPLETELPGDGAGRRVPRSVVAVGGSIVAVAWASFVLVGLRWPHVAQTSSGAGATVDQAVWRTLLADRIMAVAGWLATATALFVLGGMLFQVLVAGPVERRGPRPRRSTDRGPRPERAVVRGAAVVGVLASGAAVGLRAVELSAGSVSLGLTRLGFVATTPFGIAAFARMTGLALLAWSAASTASTASPARGRIGALGAVAVLAAFVVVGHPQATPAASIAVRAGLVAAQGVHVLTTAVWFGGICLLALDLRERRRLGDPRGSAAMVARFSSLASLAVVGTAATGLALARSQVDVIAAAPDTAYGRALIAKLGCVALVVAIGGYNRQFLVPAVEREDDSGRAWHGLRRTLLAEGLVIACGVLVATAAMTSGGI